jgi:hypothetical protein
MWLLARHTKKEPLTIGLPSLKLPDAASGLNPPYYAYQNVGRMKQTRDQTQRCCGNENCLFNSPSQQRL